MTEEASFAEMPVEMQIEMLVDDELPDEQRAALLRTLTAAQWKELSIRFLERQVEHKGVRQLISNASMFPVEAEQQATLKFPRVGRFLANVVTPRRIAAALFVGLFSATITAFVLRPGDDPRLTARHQEFVPVALPENVVGPSGGDMKVQVPVMAVTHEVTSDMFLPAESNEGGTKRSIVIVPQGGNRAVAVPLLRRSGVSIQ